MDHAIMMAHYLRAHTRYTKNIAKEEEEDIPNTLQPHDKSSSLGMINDLKNFKNTF